jgi:hypothetical protein
LGIVMINFWEILKKFKINSISYCFDFFRRVKEGKDKEYFNNLW